MYTEAIKKELKNRIDEIEFELSEMIAKLKKYLKALEIIEKLEKEEMMGKNRQIFEAISSCNYSLLCDKVENLNDSFCELKIISDFKNVD